MSACGRNLLRRINRLRAKASRKVDLSIYRNDPAGYARNVLGVTPTPTQEAIGKALLEPPYRVLVTSGHDVGKTFWGAVLVSWWYDTRDPSVTLTTAPKLDQVRDLLWKEIRSQRGNAGRGDFTGPKSLRLESSPKHFAKGVTAAAQEGFQGQHEESVLVAIDEAEGVDRAYFQGAKSMASGAGHAIICFYNPYSSTSHVAQEEQATDEQGRASWRIIPMSSLDHPNIAADLAGRVPPFPKAIRLAKVQQWINDYCTPLIGDDPKPTDVEWPPASGKWYRPSAIFEAGMLGRRPSSAVDSIWTAALVDECIRCILPSVGPLQIGADVARFGDDMTAIHIRQGGTSLHHEAVNGWNTVQIATRLKLLACQWGEPRGMDGRSVLIAVDDCGVGGGVTDQLAADRWNVAGVNVSISSPDDDKYPNLRSAIWCDLADEAANGNLSFARLTREVQATLRRELPSQQYYLDPRGRRCCVSKDEIKRLIGHSPDNADAMLLAYANVGALGDRVAGRVVVPS